MHFLSVSHGITWQQYINRCHKILSDKGFIKTTMVVLIWWADSRGEMIGTQESEVNGGTDVMARVLVTKW